MENKEKLAERLFIEALSLISKNNFTDAINRLETAHKIIPKRVSIINNLISLKLKLNDTKDTLTLSEKLLSVDPNKFDYQIIYSEVLIKNNFFNKGKRVLKKLIRDKNNFKDIQKRINIYKLFCLLYSKVFIIKKNYFYLLKVYFLTKQLEDLSFIFFCAQYLGNINKKKICDLYKTTKANFLISNKREKINIGFISGDFHHHPVGFFISDFLREIRKFFNVNLYYTISEKDYLTNKIIFESCDNFNFIQNLDEKKLIEKIKNDHIDVLVDLSGHTANNRMNIFTHRICPIQLTWIGFLGSTGIKNMDHIIVDPHVLDKDEYFSEKPLIMPNIWCTMSKPISNNIHFSNISPVKKNNFFTFGCFNNLSKINPNVIKVWSIILNKSPKSKIFLKTGGLNNKFIRSLFLREFKKNLVNENQLIFETSSPREDLLNCYNNIDLVLDTFPYSGGTTNFEASYMGAPILTKLGKSFLSNCGVSINKNLNMENFIANTEEDYVNLALFYSENVNKIIDLRKQHQNHALKSPLFDTKKFAAYFTEKIYGEYKKL